MSDIITIAGRPNVGKSTLFNRFINSRRALVNEMPGTTVDYIEAPFEWNNKSFLIVDTGGWSSKPADEIHEKMNEILTGLIKKSSTVIFVVDAKDGVVPEDTELARKLRTLNNEVILAVNKVDSSNRELNISEFHKLGFEKIIGVSAAAGRNIDALLDEASKKVETKKSNAADSIKIIILGRPNAGKSTLLNNLSSMERTIVDAKPGTTRESIDVVFEHHGRRYQIIDTPGITRRRKFASFLDYLSYLSLNKFIARADAAIMLIDAREGITKADEALAGLIKDSAIACLVAINKWDLISDKENVFKKLRAEFVRKFSFLSWAGFITISAREGIRTKNVLDAINTIYDAYSFMPEKKQVLEVLDRAVWSHPLIKKGVKFAVTDIARISNRPLTVEIVANAPEILNFSYERYLKNALRENFMLEGAPIILKFSKRGKKC